MPSENGINEGLCEPEGREMKRLTGLNGITMNNKITLGELLSLGILMVTLAGGGYALHSDIAQVRLEIAQVRLELGEKIDAKFEQVDTKVHEVSRRMADLQERVVTLETLVRVQASGMTTDK